MSDQIRRTCQQREPLHVRLWFGAPGIVAGVSMIGLGVGALMQGILFGVGVIGLGVGGILAGASVLVENRTLFGVAGIAIGVAVIAPGSPRCGMPASRLVPARNANASSD